VGDLYLRLNPVGENFIPVIATEVVIARSRNDFKGPVTDIENRDVKGAASKVVDENLPGFFALEAISR